MKKWLRRIGLVLAILLVAVAIAAFVIHRRASRVPEWYAQAKLPIPDDKNLENKIVWPLQNFAAQASTGNIDAKLPEQKRTTVVLTANQINALIAKWSNSMGIEARMSEHVRDVRVRLSEGKITIAGEAVEQKRIVSIVLQPKQSALGYGQLAMDSIRIGDATLPLVALGNQQTQLNDALARRATAMQDKLSIDDRGLATRQTADIYYTSLLTRLFSGQDADAFAFLATKQDLDHPVATRVREMKVEEGQVTLTLEILSPADRESLVEKLKSAATPPAP